MMSTQKLTRQNALDAVLNQRSDALWECIARMPFYVVFVANLATSIWRFSELLPKRLKADTRWLLCTFPPSKQFFEIVDSFARSDFDRGDRA